MNIKMILTNSFEPDVRVYKEALYLVSCGVNVEILCWDRSRNTQFPEEEVVDGIKVRRFRYPSIAGSGYRQLPSFFKYIGSVKKFLKTSEFDYIHCHDFDGRLTAFLSNVPNLKCVFDMHEFYERGSNFRKAAFQKATLYFVKHSKASLYENDVYLDLPYGRYSNKLYSLKNYPDKKMIVALPKTASHYFRVCYHGTVRNQIPYFKALFDAVSAMDNVRVEINGGGIDHDSLVELAKNYNNVVVNGTYNGLTESSRLYADTDVLFCGYDKTVPNHQKSAEAVKFFEAITTGTPMIMQKEIGMGDKVMKYGFGLAVDTDDPIQIKEAIKKFIDDKAFYESCRKNELTAADKYNWESEVAVLSKVYGIPESRDMKEVE